MKRLAILLCLISLLSACGAKEATYIDRDFGMASQYSMRTQIINPGATDTTPPEGVQPIDAERMMQAWDNTYFTPTRLDATKFEVSTGAK